MKIALSMDTSCTINKDLAKDLNIFVFPLNVIVDGVEYLDGVTISQDELLTSMRGNKSIKTSTPPPGDIIEYFKNIFAQGYDQIIHFTISSKLSSMNTLFNDISKEYFDNKIIVIDSYSVCSLMLSHVLCAYEMLQNGKSPLEIKDEIEKRKEDSFVVFIPENLKALKNGGRISPTIAALCNLIGIKPVLCFKDGALEKDSITKNVKRTMHDKINELVQKFPKENYDYTLVSFDCDEALIEFLKSELNIFLNGYQTAVLPIAINVCAHCGPGTFGLLVSKKFGKSLYDFIK